MTQRESIEDFHHRHGREAPEPSPFHVYRIEEFARNVSLPNYNRTFYKITLAWKSKGLLHYADKDVLINDNVLVFANPMIPCSWTRHSGEEEGYFCLFTEDFFGGRLAGTSLARSPLFKINGNHVLHLAAGTMDHIDRIFRLMLREMEGGYENRIEVLRNYVEIIIHEGLKIEPSPQYQLFAANGKRVCELFFELLERQFGSEARRR